MSARAWPTFGWLPPALVLAIVMAAFFGTTACHRRSEDDVHLIDEAMATRERHYRDGRMLEEQQHLTRLTRELGALEKRQAFLEQRIDERKDVIARSERRIRDLKHDLQQMKAQTDIYIDRHELYVACAYAKQIASGEGEYSEKTRNCARIASMYCAVAMVSPAFRRKVVTVKQHVDKAEESTQLLKKEISSEEHKVRVERATMPATQESIDRVAGEIAALRRRQLVPDGRSDGGDVSR